MLRSFAGTLRVVLVQLAAAVTATTQSAAIPAMDAMKLMILVSVGPFAFTGTNKLTLSLEHKDENADAWTPVPADDVRIELGDSDIAVDTNGAYAITNTIAGQGNTYAIHYLGYKKQTRVIETVGGTVSVVVGVNAVYGSPNYSTTQAAG